MKDLALGFIGGSRNSAVGFQSNDFAMLPVHKDFPDSTGFFFSIQDRQVL